MIPKKIYLHIGAPKTGSSAIQYFLMNNKSLLERYGFYYPTHDLDPNGVSGGHFGLGKYLIKGDFEQAKKVFDEYIEESKKKNLNLLLSSESFYPFPEDFKSLIGGYRVRVIGFFRDPFERIVSGYNQRVKRHFYADTLDKYCHTLLNENNEKLSGKVFLRWEDKFGSNNVDIYEYGSANRIEYMFLAALGIPENENDRFSFPEKLINRSYAESALELKRLLNAILDKENIELNNKIDVCLQSFSDKNPTPKLELSSIIDEETFLASKEKIKIDNCLTIKKLHTSVPIEQEKVLEKNQSVSNIDHNSDGLIFVVDNAFRENPEVVEYIKNLLFNQLKSKPINKNIIRLINLFRLEMLPEWLLYFLSTEIDRLSDSDCRMFLKTLNSYALLEAQKLSQILKEFQKLQSYVEYCLQHCDSKTIEITKKINIFTSSKLSSSGVSAIDGEVEQLPIIYPIEHSDLFEPKRLFKEFDTNLEVSYSKKAHCFRDDIINGNKLVSIIMPTYNRANCIMKAINSVIQQSYLNWELLIVDDGSTDNTLEILASLSDDRIKIYESQHQGVSAARNKGLESAKGDIIFYLDSDNEWTQRFLEYMLIALMYSKVKCAYSGIVILDDDNNILGYRGDAFNWTKCLEENYIDMNIFCHHRYLYEELGGFDETLKRMVDWDVILRYTKKYPPVYVPFIGCKYLNSKTDLFRISTTEPESYKNIVQTKHKAALI